MFAVVVVQNHQQRHRKKDVRFVGRHENNILVFLVSLVLTLNKLHTVL